MAAIILTEKRYEALESFESAIELPGEDFISLGETDGLEKEQRISRQYVCAEDCNVVVDGFSSQVKGGKVIKDHLFAREAMRQGAPVNVRLRFKFEAGQAIPEHLGAPLAEANHPKVKVIEVLPGAEDAPEAPAEDEKAAKPAKKKAE